MLTCPHWQRKRINKNGKKQQVHKIICLGLIAK
jgi:hypothetical protein